MARKQTSAAVAAIAGRHIAGEPLADVQVRIAIGQAIHGTGLPMNERHVDRVIDAIGEALAPLFDDLRTLAASCLAHDETPPIKLDPPA